MPIKEESFRIGCGRYLQKAGGLSLLGEEVSRFGSSALVVGGATALGITKNRIEKSLEGLKFEIIEHRGTCNDFRALELVKHAKENGFDVIVGVGGGVIMDFAKLIANEADLPIINLPTSSATCAAYTPLSVRYTADGRTVGSKHFKREVDAVLVDTEIIAAQPTRLLLSGVFDALAKFVEIKQRFGETDESPLGLDWAFLLSQKSFSDLVEKTEKCISDSKDTNVTVTVDEVVFTTIAVTGIISGIARGSNQCALAHKFYEGTREMFFEESRTYLHGEIVGVGMLLQNHFNGDADNNDFLLSLMKKYNMPSSLPDIGITPDLGVQRMYFEKLKNGSAIDETSPEELEKLQAGLDYLWGIK